MMNVLLTCIILPYMICLTNISYYRIRVITKCADTGPTPPAETEIGKAFKLPTGFRTVSFEFVATVVSTV